MIKILYLPLAAGLLSLLFALYKYKWVDRQSAGNAKMVEISAAIKQGSMAFLKREYRILLLIAIAVAVLITLPEKGFLKLVAFSYAVGALFSGLAGFIGMKAATNANSRTTEAARKGIVPALRVAFNGGSVMGLSVVGLSIIGLSGLTILYTYFFGSDPEALNNTVIPILSGYSLGASSVALFARVGGGIFTKAADVGADLRW